MKEQKLVRIKGMQVIENECIWMKAGVVNFRLCDNAYDCTTCPFDTGMGKAMKSKSSSKKNIGENSPTWAESLRQKFKNDERPCRHVLTGRIDPPKTCPNNYECNHCSFDQWLDDFDLSQQSKVAQLKSASGYQMADDYYYHPCHTWASFQHGGFCRVGFDDFLVRLFGPMDSINMPQIGSKVKQGTTCMSFKRDNKTACVVSPISGTVLAVNHLVASHPHIVHSDSYNNGWLLTIEPDMPKRNTKRLYFGSESIHWIDKESQRLLEVISPEYKNLAATGGEPLKDIYGSVSGLEWDKLVETFLAQ